MRYWTIPVLLACLAGLSAAAGAEAPKTKPAASSPGDLYDRIAGAYMKGEWDQLEKELAASPKELAALSQAQQSDVAYVRQALAECRPAWWKQCKAGRKVLIRPTVWDRTLNATYDPNGKGGIELKTVGREQTLLISWDAGNMDNPDPAEYGFLKGDLAGLGVWHTLGIAATWAAMPAQALANLSEKDKLRLQLYWDFRGNVTGLYYGGPPARRRGLHIYLAAYMEKYGKGPMAASRRAVASMFLTQVLSSPAKYPSLKLPDTLAAESAEEKLAVYFKFKIGRKTYWTIAEDKAFREAVKAFAANDKEVLQAGKVTLPNGLVYALMAEDDASLRAKRDAWVKAQFDKAGAK